MKYFALDLLVEVSDDLSIDDFEYKFRTLIENNNWSAVGKVIETDESEKPIDGKMQILTLI